MVQARPEATFWWQGYAVKLSIGMATYNGAKHLPVQLDSFLAQTRLPDELVVSDDGAGLPAARPAGGHGLVNMARRAERWGGQLELGAGPAGGTVVTWQVPMVAR